MLHCNVGNTKVGCNTDSQEEVKDRWLHPVRIHHLFQLVIENKLWVPVESRNSSGHIAFLDSAVRTAQTSAPSKLTQ